MKISNLALTAISILSVPTSQSFTTHRSHSRGVFLPKSSRTTNSLKSQTTVSAGPSISTPTKEEWDKTTQAVVSKLSSSPAVPEPMKPMLEMFVEEYFSQTALNPTVSPTVASSSFLNMAQLWLRFGLSSQPFCFEGTSHVALRGGEDTNELNLDFYDIGNQFFRPAMDLDRSVILGQDNLREAFDKMAKGDNVVFLANHQSEADPQVLSVLLEQKMNLPEEASRVVFVAGHKVTTDPLAIPFSMGRNLICIHSKKHINTDPESKPAKQKQNLAAMANMLDMMRRGGLALWVAPSGGRDRRDLTTGTVPVAPFDQKTVDMFRLMARKSKVTTHFYPLAMFSYDLCPPPDTIEAGVGEVRNVRYSPIGVACGEVLENEGGVEQRQLFTEMAQDVCEKEYRTLIRTIDEKRKEGGVLPPPL